MSCALDSKLSGASILEMFQPPFFFDFVILNHVLAIFYLFLGVLFSVRYLLNIFIKSLISNIVDYLVFFLVLFITIM